MVNVFLVSTTQRVLFHMAVLDGRPRRRWKDRRLVRDVPPCRQLVSWAFDWQWLVDDDLEWTSTHLESEQPACERPMPDGRLERRWADGHVVRNKLGLWHLVSRPLNRQRMVDVDCDRGASTRLPGKRLLLYWQPQRRQDD